MTQSQVISALTFCAALIFCSSLGLAQSGSRTKSSEATAPKKPLAKGDSAPAVVLPNLEGESVNLKSVFAKGPTVLVVLRGYPGYQCPICSRQVSQFVRKAKEFEAGGAQVVMIYPGDAANLAERSKEFLSGLRLPRPITFLLDPDYKFTNAYGIRWNAPNETAYPSTYVIASNLRVTFAKISKTHGGRTDAEEVLKNL